MIALLSLAGSLVVGGLAYRFGAEDRPGFNEQPETPRDRRAWL